MTTRTVFDIAADCDAMTTIYAEAMARHAVDEVRYAMHPEDLALLRRWSESRMARDNVFSRLLDTIHDLRCAGGGPAAGKVVSAMSRVSQLAMEEAIRHELSTMKGAA